MQRYKDHGGVTAEQLQRIKASLMELCDAAGLTDDTKQFTHEEFKERNAYMLNHAQIHDTILRTILRSLVKSL